MADEETLVDETPVPESDLGPPESEPLASESAVEDQAPAEPTEEPAQEWVDIRAAATEAGFDLSGHEDDTAALQHLIAEARQAEAARTQAQQWQQMAAQLQQNQQPPPAPAPAPEEPTFWSAPEYNPNWLTQVDRDEQGNLIPANGGTPETVAKLNAYLQYRADQQSNFWDAGPQKYMDPYIEHRFQQMFAEQSQHLRRGILEEHQATQFLKDNNDWLFQAPNQLSEEGQLFQRALTDLSDKPGLSSQDQQQLAMQQVELYRAQQKLAQLETAPSAAADKKKQDFLKKEAGLTTPNSSGTERQTANSEGETPLQNPHMSLAEQIKARLDAAGITDDDMASNY